MTPLQLSILTHYYGCAGDFRNGDFSAPAVREAIDFFIAEDMIWRTLHEAPPPHYRLTSKGNFFVEHLCSIPLPEIKFYIP